MLLRLLSLLPTVAANFALMPAQAIAGVIDCSGQCSWQSVICLTSDIKFNITPEDLAEFLNNLSVHASAHNWREPDEGILANDSKLANQDCEKCDMIDECGKADLKLIVDHNFACLHLTERKAQESNVLCQCLMNSLSGDGKTKIIQCKKEHNIAAENHETCQLGVSHCS